MSALQKTAKRHIEPLLLGSHPVWTAHEQLVFARWAAMFTMVHEYTNLMGQAVIRKDRERFASLQVLGDSWLIYRAPFGEPESSPIALHRVLLAQQINSENKGTPLAQATVAAAAQMTFLTIYTRFEHALEGSIAHFDTIARRYGMFRVWPLRRELGDPYVFATLPVPQRFDLYKARDEFGELTWDQVKKSSA